MMLQHFTKMNSHKELWIDLNMNLRHERIIKLQKIKYKLKHGNTNDFVPKRPH